MLYLPPFSLSLSLQLGLSSLFLCLPLSSSVINAYVLPSISLNYTPTNPSFLIIPLVLCPHLYLCHTLPPLSLTLSLSLLLFPLPSLPLPFPYSLPSLFHSPTDPGLWSSASHGQRDDRLRGNEVLACSRDHAQLDAL